MNVKTGTSSKTVIVTGGGYHTVEAPPVCGCCKASMQPLAWLCGGCGETA